MIRLQKLLAEAGLGSRRTIEEWIRAGRRARAVGLDGRRLDLKPGEAVPGELLLYYRPVGGPARFDRISREEPADGEGGATAASGLISRLERAARAPGGTAVRSKPRSAPPGRRLPDGGSAAPPAAEPPRRPAT